MTYVKGVGMSTFDVEPLTGQERIMSSINEALGHSNMAVEDIDGIFIANNELSLNGERQRHTGPMVSSLLQLKVPIVTIPAACAGGGVALWNAARHLNNSSKKNILVLAYETLVANKQEFITDEILMAAERTFEQREGLIFPAQNALVAQQYMRAHGATEDDFALVSAKNHENAVDNEKARFYGKKISLEDIKNSPVVASPLRLLDCSVPCNGSAAVIISKDETDVKLSGSGMATTYLTTFERDQLTSWESTREAAKVAYQQAGITAQDVQIAEIHDAFSPIELMAYEDLGFTQEGKGMEMVRNNETVLSGRLPANTSGGLKARGHPISATGIAQVYEIVKQLRKEAGKRQVDGLTHGLTHNVGGAGSMTAVHTFKKVA